VAAEKFGFIAMDGAGSGFGVEIGAVEAFALDDDDGAGAAHAVFRANAQQLLANQRGLIGLNEDLLEDGAVVLRGGFILRSGGAGEGEQ